MLEVCRQIRLHVQSSRKLKLKLLLNLLCVFHSLVPRPYPRVGYIFPFVFSELLSFEMDSQQQVREDADYDGLRTSLVLPSQLYDSMAAHQSRHHQGLGSSDTPAPYAPAPAATVSDAAAQARLIAARLAASLGAGSAGGMSSALPSVFASAPHPSEDFSDPSDPIAKARAIAARLSGVLGKRRADGDAPGGFSWGKGDSSKLQSKIRVPVETGHNYSGLLIGPKGATLKQMEADSGARVYLRGRGTSKPSDASLQPTGDEEEDMHVLIVAETDEQVGGMPFAPVWATALATPSAAPPPHPPTPVRAPTARQGYGARRGHPHAPEPSGRAEARRGAGRRLLVQCDAPRRGWQRLRAAVRRPRRARPRQLHDP